MCTWVNTIIVCLKCDFYIISLRYIVVSNPLGVLLTGTIVCLEKIIILNPGGVIQENCPVLFSFILAVRTLSPHSGGCTSPEDRIPVVLSHKGLRETGDMGAAMNSVRSWEGKANMAHDLWGWPFSWGPAGSGYSSCSSPFGKSCWRKQ